MQSWRFIVSNIFFQNLLFIFKVNLEDLFIYLLTLYFKLTYKISQPANIYSKLTIETLEEGVDFVQS